jgi:hypothetical protein
MWLFRDLLIVHGCIVKQNPVFSKKTGFWMAGLFLRHFNFLRRDLELGRILQRLLHLAQIRRADKRIMILLRKCGRHLNFQFDLVHHAGRRVGGMALEDADALGGDAALAAEAEDVDARARANRRQEHLKRHGRRIFTAAARRLVGLDGVAAEMSVYARTAGEVYDHFHSFTPIV